MKKNLVVTLSDEAYVDQAKALFSSLYWQAGWRGDYMLLAFQIPDPKLRWFEQRGIIVRECREIFGEKQFKRLHRKSVKPVSPLYLKIVLKKFLLFTPEFKKWGNIVYLDCDVLVNGPLNRLLEGSGFKAVVDGAPTLRQQFKATAGNQGVYDQLKAEYNLGRPAFNAGVFSFNTDLIDADTYDSLKSLFKKYYPASHYFDQPILNLFFHDNWRPLPLIYNAQTCWLKWSGRADAKVIHFTDQHKPWEAESRLHPLWRRNLGRADAVDVRNPVEGVGWSALKEEKHEILLRILRQITLLDERMGQAGEILRGGLKRD